MHSVQAVTWNIHKCIGGIDRQYRPERVIAVLREVNADLVLLQEVDEDAPRSRRHRQVDLLGDALDYPHRAYIAHKHLRQGRYGNAVLSRFPLDHAEGLDLSRKFRIPRAALHVRLTFEAGGERRRLWVYNVHLGLEESERKAQLSAVLGWHDARKVAQSTAILIAGDFNDVWNSAGAGFLDGQGFHGLAIRPRTFPAFRPLRPLDAAFVRGPVRLTQGMVPPVPLAKAASDHLPVAFRLKPS